MYQIIEKVAEKYGYSVYGLAKASGVSYSRITNLKYGIAKEVYFSTVKQLADFLEISMDEFRD